MENDILKKENNNVIDLRGKSDEEIFKAYAQISDDTLTLHELLKKYDDKEYALKEYHKIKEKRIEKK